jgi:hypothetical protein
VGEEEVRCAECGLDYPSSAICSLEKGTERTDLCGICLLVMVNKMNGTDQTEFLVSSSERIRLAAVAWRRLHP